MACIYWKVVCKFQIRLGEGTSVLFLFVFFFNLGLISKMENVHLLTQTSFVVFGVIRKKFESLWSSYVTRQF